MALTPGTLLGPYEVTAQLGVGGMGEVYRATDTKLKRQVAIKILPSSLAADPDRLARFQREAEVLGSLNHPNIGSIYGLEEANGITALVMELVEGEDLSRRIARGAILLDEALPIAKQLTEALEAAHARGIVHRDLKPANIKLTVDGRVKVLDFGLAKVFAAEPDAVTASKSPTIVGTMGSAGVILGTASYMSPEQARGKPVDARTDVWAFGCVLYEMLTSKQAFGGETITDILGAIVKTDPDWTALPRETPSAIRRLLKRCLVKDLNERLHAIADARLEITDVRTDSDTAVQNKTSVPNGRGLRLIAGVAVVAAIALAVPAVLYFRASPSAVSDALETRLEITTPPTTDPISFALSPDGRRVVFAGSGGGSARLWVRSFDSVTPQPILGTEGGGYPFWSPDSGSIGFFSGAKLKRINIDGSALQELADVSPGRGGTWNRDGIILYAASSAAGLFRVSMSGGEVKPVTRMSPGQVNHRFPHFLPDGRRFLYFAVGTGEVQGVYLGSLDSSETKRLAPADTAAAFAPSGHILYVRQGALVAQAIDLVSGATTGDATTVSDVVGNESAIGVGAFSVSASGTIAHRTGGPGRRQFTWFDRTGRALGTIGEPQEFSQSYPELSPDGKRVVFEMTAGNNRDIYVSDVTRGFPQRFTTNVWTDTAPLWSSDGSLVIFRSNRKGFYDLFQKSSDTDSAETALIESPRAKVPVDSSSDGRFLLYTVGEMETLQDLWVMPFDGDRKPSPIAVTRFDERQGQFSPNGRWVAYQSNETGQLEIYARPFRGPGHAERISAAGGASPRWSANGRELFYLTADGRLMSSPVNTDGSSLDPGTPTALFQPRIAGGAFGNTAGTLRQQYDVAADGRFLMNVTTEETSPPIIVILNWKPK